MGQYDTKLTPQEEATFKEWKQKYAPKDSGFDYDLRGAFKSGLKPDPKTGHWPDTFKKPNHPTFSNESKYATGANANKAGRWKGDKFMKYNDPAEMGPQMPAKVRKARNRTALQAVAGVGKGGIFSKGGKYGGKVKMETSVDAKDAMKGKRSKKTHRLVKEADSFHPSDMMRESNREPSLGETLSQIASGVGPGKTSIGAAVSGGISGAAIGATIGESISKSNAARKKKSEEEMKGATKKG